MYQRTDVGQGKRNDETAGEMGHFISILKEKRKRNPLPAPNTTAPPNNFNSYHNSSRREKAKDEGRWPTRNSPIPSQHPNHSATPGNNISPNLHNVGPPNRISRVVPPSTDPMFLTFQMSGSGITNMNYEFKGSKNSYAEVEDFEIQQKVLEGKLPPHLVKFDRNNHMRNYGRNNNTTVNASSNANTYIYNNKSSNININIHLDNPGQGPEVPDGPPQKKQRLEAPAPTTTKRSKSTSPPPQVASWQILNSEQLPSVSILKVDETSSEETPLGDDNGVLPSINELLQGVTSRNSTWHV